MVWFRIRDFCLEALFSSSSYAPKFSRDRDLRLQRVNLLAGIVRALWYAASKREDDLDDLNYEGWVYVNADPEPIST